MNKALINENDYLEAIKSDDELVGYENHYLRYLPEKFKTIEFLKRIIDENIVTGDYYYLFQYFPNEFRDNKEIIIKAVNKQGLSINYASDRLKNDKEIVLTAIKQNRQACYYIGDNLKKELANNISCPIESNLDQMLKYLEKAIILEELEVELKAKEQDKKKLKV